MEVRRALRDCGIGRDARSGGKSASGAQLIEVLGRHVLAEDLDRLGTLTLGSIDRGFGDFDVDDLGFDEPTAFQRVHAVQPLITDEAIGWLLYRSDANAPEQKAPTDFSIGAFATFKSLAVTYSCMPEGHTTIGAQRFHFRVRYGIGWFPLAIAARQTGSRRSRLLCFKRSPAVNSELF